jgi:hypothetical protein
MGNSLNLKEINQEETLNLLRFSVKTGSNLFLFGRRGIGKTFLSLQAARECGYKISYVNLSVIERPDLAGYPMINDASDVIIYKQPYYLPKLESGAKSDQILLFDEVDKCHSEITAPLLELLQFRSINGKPINAAACILTGNLISEGSYSNNLSTALLDRGAKFVLSFNFQQWLKWARDAGVHELILGFLIRHPELACGEIESVEFASPSPRGWTLASEAMHDAAKLNVDDIDTIESIIAGYVGAAVAVQFRVWFEQFRRFEPVIHTLLERGTCSIDYASLDPTEKFIFCLTLAHFAKVKVLDYKVKPKFRYLENLCNFLDKNEVEAEIQLVSLKNAFPMNEIVKHRLINCKIFFDKVSKFTEIVG